MSNIQSWKYTDKIFQMCFSQLKSESQFLPQEHETSEHNRRYLINFGVADLAERQNAIIGSPLIWINEG